MKNRRFLWVLLTPVLRFLLQTPVQAQTPAGTVLGTITDGAGAVALLLSDLGVSRNQFPALCLQRQPVLRGAVHNPHVQAGNSRALRLYPGCQSVLPRLFQLVQQRRLPFGTELPDAEDGPFRPDRSRPRSSAANARLHSATISGALRERPQENRRAAGQGVDQPACSRAGGSLDSGRRCLNLVGIFRNGKQNTNHLSDRASLPRRNAKVGDLLSFLEEGLQ